MCKVETVAKKHVLFIATISLYGEGEEVGEAGGRGGRGEEWKPKGGKREDVDREVCIVTFIS
jgi:hypothetical protein